MVTRNEPDYDFYLTRKRSRKLNNCLLVVSLLSIEEQRGHVCYSLVVMEWTFATIAANAGSSTHVIYILSQLVTFLFAFHVMRTSPTSFFTGALGI